ncbi:DNA cytosine methyltransferase [Hoeflea sp. 108]|uniref:DNA cytosine methyltransferase n=1 Tax=Hoeflea sp. 108 TaxID=1116369 RepID=UPI0012F82BAF|nr:DNA cytosine methyltransferase [Hoeflea sp. 108]
MINAEVSRGGCFLRAIDLYAGIGGWSLGLRLAGVDVVASYEWWQPAIDTHNSNHAGDLRSIDIRKLCLEDLPQQIDLVVGSPPCTEFSYANRGGRGNISEGLKDLVKFLEVVDYLKPTFWALENVPRVAQVLRHGFDDPEHALYRFRHLKPEIAVIDFSDYGAAQARKRCIAGNIPFSLLETYRTRLPSRTLGDVIQNLAAPDVVTDPLWGVTLPVRKLTEAQAEAPLNGEELRMNRESKEFHPVYNNMAFPDPFPQPSRTVTATCTRVSRESIVIADPKAPGAFRRLTIRERASLQGFPITYQFYARSFAEKAKMVGNAIPPTFTYLVAHAAQRTPVKSLPSFDEAGASLVLPAKVSAVTPPDTEGRSYPETRSFRAALPGLRFKSGMRFDLSNDFIDGGANWKVRFFFGPSKDIQEVDLDGSVELDLRHSPLVGSILVGLQGNFARIESKLCSTNPATLQAVWTRRAEGLGPYELTDFLGELSEKLHDALLGALDVDALQYLTAYVVTVADQSVRNGKLPGQRKLEKNAIRILSGFVVADWFNTLSWHDRRQLAA